MDPGDTLFEDKLYELQPWMYRREHREAALTIACRETSSKTWLRNLLLEWAKDLLNKPDSQPAPQLAC